MRGKGGLVKTVVAETCFSGEILPGTVSKLHEKHWGCRCEGMAFLSCSFPQHQRQPNRSVLPHLGPERLFMSPRSRCPYFMGTSIGIHLCLCLMKTKGSLKTRYSWMSYKHSHFTRPWGMTHLKHPCSKFFEEQRITQFVYIFLSRT